MFYCSSVVPWLFHLFSAQPNGEHHPEEPGGPVPPPGQAGGCRDPGGVRREVSQAGALCPFARARTLTSFVFSTVQCLPTISLYFFPPFSTLLWIQSNTVSGLPINR